MLARLLLIFCLLVFTACEPDPIDDGKRFPEPVQTELKGMAPWEFRGFKITPLAKYEIEGRVISTITHWFLRESEISPIDVAIGWGVMSDPTLYKKLKMGQGGRFYYWSWGAEGPPIPGEEIPRNSSNTHVIPANDGVEEVLERVKPYQTLRMECYLVTATTPDGWHWNSSTSRTDKGYTACEVMWVERVQVK